MQRFLPLILLSALVAWNAPAASAAPLRSSSQAPASLAGVVPDPRMGPNAIDEAGHALSAALLVPASSRPMPLHAPSTTSLVAPLTVAPPATPFHREVFGFAPYWSLGVNAQWDYRLMNTIAYFGLTINRDGQFDTGAPGWNQWNSQDLVNIINNAHAAGSRVVVVIKQFNQEAVNRIVTDPALSQVAITNTINAIASKNLDGVNVDFEAQTGAPYFYIQDGMTRFMRMLSQQVHARWPAAEVSIDTYSGSASWDGGIFKIGDLAPVVDAMFIMAYDMVFENQPGVAGANAPLTHYTFNDSLAVSQYLTKAPASKILLGVPYYGYKWSTTGNGPNATINPAEPGAQADTYANIVAELACGLQYRSDGWDAFAQSPYVSWYSPAVNDPCEGNHGSWRELYYDSAQSLGIKYDLVNQNNLRGAGMWALGYDGGATELWNVIAQKLTTVTNWDSLGGISTADPAAASSGTSRIDLFIKGADSALWHQVWNGTIWLGWESLGGVVSSAPAAVSTAANSVDVFLRGADNALWHRTWDGAAWQAWDSLGGNLTSGPGAASWSAVRMDVFVRGTDNALWHRSWNGTQWQQWEGIGGVLTSDPASVSWTNGRLDVFVRGADNAIWHRAYDTGGWAAWESLKGSFASAPAVASCGRVNLDLFAVGADRALWRKTFNSYGGWGDWQSQGGQWAGGPAAVCRPGMHMVDVFERAQNGVMWHTAVSDT